MKKNNLFNNWLFWVLTAVFVGFIGLSWYIYDNQQKKIITVKHDELYDLSRIKIKQIQDWISERKAEGLFVSVNNDFSNLASNYIQNSSENNLSELQEWIKQIRESHDYCAVFLFDSDKNLYSIFDDDNYKSSIDTAFFMNAFSSNKIELSDFHIMPDGKLFIDVIAPLTKIKSNKHVLVCLRIDPEPQFFPFLQLNLINYPSAEFLLLKKENDSVMYLNELRFRPNSAMKLKLPLSRTTLPSVQAILGKLGFTEGKDYRGVNVIAYINKLEGTQWYALNKVDKEDVFKELDYLVLLIILIIFLILSVLFIIMLFRDMTIRRIHGNKLSELTAHLVDVREKERISIARELHDDFGQLLTSIKMNTAILTRELKKKEAGDLSLFLQSEIHQINSTVDKTVQGLRRLITFLRPVELDNLGLIPAIQSLVADFRKTSFIDCDFDTNIEELKMSDDAKLSIYRIIQESLTNISRHSKADVVNIKIRKEDELILISIKDDGVGMQKADPFKGKSFGLIGIRERVENLNGLIDIISAPGKGTQIKIKIPFHSNGKRIP